MSQIKTTKKNQNKRQKKTKNCELPSTLSNLQDIRPDRV